MDNCKEKIDFKISLSLSYHSIHLSFQFQFQYTPPPNHNFNSQWFNQEKELNQVIYILRSGLKVDVANYVGYIG